MPGRIKSAWKHRREEGVYIPEVTNVFRLVHAEGDGLPGLIIDYYNGAVVIQVHSIGMFRMLEIRRFMKMSRTSCFLLQNPD